MGTRRAAAVLCSRSGDLPRAQIRRAVRLQGRGRYTGARTRLEQRGQGDRLETALQVRQHEVHVEFEWRFVG
jgi:hypothetical protein